MIVSSIHISCKIESIGRSLLMDKTDRWQRTVDEIFPSREFALVVAFQTEKYNYAMHEHDFWEINIILEGSGYHYIEQRSLTVYPGDVFVIPPGVLHGYSNIDPRFNVFHLAVRYEFFDIYAAELSRLKRYRMLFEIEPMLRVNEQNFYMNLDYRYLIELKNDIIGFDELKIEESDETDTMRSILALKVISSLCRYASQHPERMRENDSLGYYDILGALEYIHNNFSEKIAVNELAKMCSMSKATFLRKFKACTQNTPGQYILDYRCKAARRLLTLGMLRTEAAQQCGFFDVSHLDKSLHKSKKV